METSPQGAVSCFKIPTDSTAGSFEAITVAITFSGDPYCAWVSAGRLLKKASAFAEASGEKQIFAAISSTFRSVMAHTIVRNAASGVSDPALIADSIGTVRLC